MNSTQDYRTLLESISVRDHSFRLYAQFFEKNNIFNPRCAHVRGRIWGQEMLVFRKNADNLRMLDNLAYALNE